METVKLPEIHCDIVATDFRLLLALGRLLERIRERRVLVLRLHLLKRLHHQHIPAGELARTLLATRATSLGHLYI